MPSSLDRNGLKAAAVEFAESLRGQKIFGLGYDLLVFVYEKTDAHETQSAAIDVRHALFIDRSRTGDYQTTRGIREILDRGGNVDDLVAFMEDRNLPLDEIGRMTLAERVLSDRPTLGYITISNALQYGHAIANAGVDGVEDLVS